MAISSWFYKNLVYYPIVFARGEWVPHYLRKMEKFQWADEQALQALRERKFLRLSEHALQHVPYYRESPGYQSLNKQSHRLADVGKFPFLTKSDLKLHSERLRSEKHRGLVTFKTTGGSTGQPVTVAKSRSATAQELAANWRGFSWAGVKIGDAQARFWGVPITPKARFRAQMIDLVAHRRRCSAFSFTEDHMEEYRRQLNRFRPAYFYGYVSMLREYAQFLEATGKKHDFQLRAVITTSEVLTSYDRQLLERVFETKVFNEYGCGELGTVAHECPAGGMHINSENLLIEIFDGERPCAAGETGEIVATEMNNLAMPLIRYRLGDFAALSVEPCPCGRTLPVLENICGRAYDIVRNRAGQMFHGEFFMYILEDATRKGMGILAFQVIQEDYEHFTIRVQPGPGYGAQTENFVRERIRSGYDARADVEFETVGKIEREKSGKMRLIKAMEPDAHRTVTDRDVSAVNHP